jgi:hypothetical protein
VLSMPGRVKKLREALGQELLAGGAFPELGLLEALAPAVADVVRGSGDEDALVAAINDAPAASKTTPDFPRGLTQLAAAATDGDAPALGRAALALRNAVSQAEAGEGATPVGVGVGVLNGLAALVAGVEDLQVEEVILGLLQALVTPPSGGLPVVKPAALHAWVAGSAAVEPAGRELVLKAAGEWAKTV